MGCPPACIVWRLGKPEIGRGFRDIDRQQNSIDDLDRSVGGRDVSRPFNEAGVLDGRIGVDQLVLLNLERAAEQGLDLARVLDLVKRLAAGRDMIEQHVLQQRDRVVIGAQRGQSVYDRTERVRLVTIGDIGTEGLCEANEGIVGGSEDGEVGAGIGDGINQAGSLESLQQNVEIAAVVIEAAAGLQHDIGDGQFAGTGLHQDRSFPS